MLILPGPALYKGPCFYLVRVSCILGDAAAWRASDVERSAAVQANHRSWGDFFIDVLTTEGHAQMLSRQAPFAGSPRLVQPKTRRWAMT